MSDVSPVEKAKTELLPLLEMQRAAFEAEGEVAYETRIDRLDRCLALIVDNKEAICEAVKQASLTQQEKS